MTDADPAVRQILNRHPSVGLAIGVIRDGRLEQFHGHGLANVESRTPVGEDTVFRIASITKTFTAVAVLQLSERGLVELDRPATDYLRAYTLEPARPAFRPPTLRELLTHTAGAPQVASRLRALKSLFGGEGLSRLTEGGESFELGRPLPTLASYYGGRLRLEAEPGTRFTYGDHGFATLGQIVEDVTGEPLDRYLRDAIFEPLGMADSDLLRSPRLVSRLATGYILGAAGPRAVTDRQWVTAASSSIYSTPRDMGRYLAALVGRGANERGSILRPATVAQLFEPQLRTDPRVGGVGLGFFRGVFDGHVVAEHQGILPGFDSQVYLAPNDAAAVMAFSNGTRQGTNWLPHEVGGLLRQVLGLADDAIRDDVPQHPEVWGEICGWYPLHAPLTDTQVKLVIGLGVEISVRRGRLVLSALSPIPVMYRGLTLHPDDPDDPYVFRVDLSRHGIGPVRIVFSRHAGGVTRIHSDWLPVSLARQRGGRSPHRWIAAGVPALAAGVGVAAVARRRAASS